MVHTLEVCTTLPRLNDDQPPLIPLSRIYFQQTFPEFNMHAHIRTKQASKKTVMCLELGWMCQSHRLTHFFDTFNTRGLWSSRIFCATGQKSQEWGFTKESQILGESVGQLVGQKIWLDCDPLGLGLDTPGVDDCTYIVT